MGFQKTTNIKWNFLKTIEEPEFGPGVVIKTLYIVGELESHDWKLEGLLVRLLVSIFIG